MERLPVEDTALETVYVCSLDGERVKPKTVIGQVLPFAGAALGIFAFFFGVSHSGNDSFNG
jgi:hypothetical protein